MLAVAKHGVVAALADALVPDAFCRSFGQRAERREVYHKAVVKLRGTVDG
jgi:hypothetical protein